ncbi:Uncharacterised protein [Raoultella planticola]|uniref:Uncharacterized protein n=1 Tax=Raoultella planticola TaxID=575 RepID=A0A485ASJ3_RAOPL|nr:Uncharacterised protein [Raoultella planticola]
MSQREKNYYPPHWGLLSLVSISASAAEALSLQGKTIGVAVVGTQHFWDREAYKGATGGGGETRWQGHWRRRRP